MSKRISKIFQAAEEIPFDDTSKIILMSDCHRGNGGWADNFSSNQNIYFAALTHYYNENFTYIELGDGDELWENTNISDIIQVHSNAFWLMSKFYEAGRLYFIYGNHDMVKRSKRYVKKNLYQYFDERQKKYIPLFPDIKIHEGLVLKHRVTDDKIFLLHGHQVDPLNSTWWRLSRFLVRFLWKPLESFGVKNPTSTAKNYTKKEAVADRLTKWVTSENHMLIAGHNHRPSFAEVGDPPYFNDGTIVHPRCITGIEIEGGNISLIKWCVKTKYDGTLFVDREVLAGPRKLSDYFNLLNTVKWEVNVNITIQKNIN